jgi:hypothetical protein
VIPVVRKTTDNTLGLGQGFSSSSCPCCHAASTAALKPIGHALSCRIEHLDPYFTAIHRILLPVMPCVTPGRGFLPWRPLVSFICSFKSKQYWQMGLENEEASMASAA